MKDRIRIEVRIAFRLRVVVTFKFMFGVWAIVKFGSYNPYKQIQGEGRSCFTAIHVRQLDANAMVIRRKFDEYYFDRGPSSHVNKLVYLPPTQFLRRVFSAPGNTTCLHTHTHTRYVHTHTHTLTHTIC